MSPFNKKNNIEKEKSITEPPLTERKRKTRSSPLSTSTPPLKKRTTRLVSNDSLLTNQSKIADSEQHPEEQSMPSKTPKKTINFKSKARTSQPKRTPPPPETWFVQFTGLKRDFINLRKVLLTSLAEIETLCTPLHKSLLSCYVSLEPLKNVLLRYHEQTVDTPPVFSKEPVRFKFNNQKYNTVQKHPQTVAINPDNNSTEDEFDEFDDVDYLSTPSTRNKKNGHHDYNVNPPEIIHSNPPALHEPIELELSDLCKLLTLVNMVGVSFADLQLKLHELENDYIAMTLNSIQQMEQRILPRSLYDPECNKKDRLRKLVKIAMTEPTTSEEAALLLSDIPHPEMSFQVQGDNPDIEMSHNTITENLPTTDGINSKLTHVKIHEDFGKKIVICPHCTYPLTIGCRVEENLDKTLDSNGNPPPKKVFVFSSDKTLTRQEQQECADDMGLQIENSKYAIDNSSLQLEKPTHIIRPPLPQRIDMQRHDLHQRNLHTLGVDHMLNHIAPPIDKPSAGETTSVVDRNPVLFVGYGTGV